MKLEKLYQRSIDQGTFVKVDLKFLDFRAPIFTQFLASAVMTFEDREANQLLFPVWSIQNVALKLKKNIPVSMKVKIGRKDVDFYKIDAVYLTGKKHLVSAQEFAIRMYDMFIPHGHMVVVEKDIVFYDLDSEFCHIFRKCYHEINSKKKLNFIEGEYYSLRYFIDEIRKASDYLNSLQEILDEE